MSDQSSLSLNTGLGSVLQVGGNTSGALGSVNIDGKIQVVLVRAGVQPKGYKVPLGTTVGQLLTHAQATVTNQTLRIGESEVNESHVLQNGDALFVVPKPKNG